MRLNPRVQGDLGERSAMLWFGAQGAGVFIPVFHCRDFDLIAYSGDELTRVQVRTSTVLRRARWQVAVCTSGGNQSWNGLVKRLDPSAYDYLFALVGDGRRWFIPAAEVGGGRSISLGGPRYAAYEIEPDKPLGDRPANRIGTPVRR